MKGEFAVRDMTGVGPNGAGEIGETGGLDLIKAACRLFS